MSEGYVFDLNRAEFNDDFSSSTGSGELWQVYARQQLVSNLTAILNDAEQYGRGRAVNPRETWLSHNAILVTSPRGSGKTVFLRNCEAMWRSENTDKKDALLFLDVIDPTMLMAQDSFANVIVAQIYQAVNNKLERSNCCDEQSRNERDDFHRRLKKLADAMGKTCEFNGAIGIDKILKYSSGIQLESYFHLFVESAIKILGCKAIVVSIDDVDMAMERAFEVVDDVRRFLGCPYLIPIVSGEIKLYEHMTQKHFDDKAYDNRCRDAKLTDKGKELSEHLTMAYLTKVFPSPMRINLFSIERLLNKMQLKYGQDSKRSISYLDYQESVFNQFYFLCRNRDARRNWTMPESARELTQLVRSLPPTSLEQSEKDADISKQIVLYNNFKNWAMQKKNGEALVFAESALSLLHDSEAVFDIRKILAFNLVQQTDANLYPWAKYHVLEEQESRLKELAKQGGEKINNASLLQAALGTGDRKSLKAMPPLEFLVDKLYITLNTANEKSDPISISNDSLVKVAQDSGWELKGQCYIEDIMLDVYTESGFYSQLSNSYKFVFFSRSFELLIYSILTNKNESALLSDIYQILSRKPFYSLPALTDTKIALTGEEDTEHDSYDDSNLYFSTLALCDKIQIWRKEHCDLFEQCYIPRLIPLLSYCFNSTFTALNVIKANFSHNMFGYEHLSDMVLRFKYNVLNALIRCGIQGQAVYANVLVGAKSETVRSKREIFKYERVYKRNLAILKEELSSSQARHKDTETSNYIMKLHDAVNSHPIFNITSDISNPLLRLNSHPIIVSMSYMNSLDELSKMNSGLSQSEQAGLTMCMNFLGTKVDRRVKTFDKIYNSLYKILVDDENPRESEVLREQVQKAKILIEKMEPDFINRRDFLSLDTRLKNMIKAVLKLDLGDVQGN
ncbi:hypothetical protein CWC22_011655 [Pseudoalteromonas rubra]|uniref:Uncharacterized protein n=1 Tax=Pseudoalteromonas rubra TaxID=43658 RepID=A0A5S3V3H3_9GAMM|nr:antiviral RADAR system adenosine triphosphatase RdrA [Pseudoalteromonas rubra]QPB83608.1 hypothetical protein CWC22_011655 [Pseudoalteromonas rubra]